MCDKISNPSHCPRHGPGVYAFVSTFVSPKSDCTVEPSLCNARCSGQLCKSSTPMIQSPEVIKHYTDRDDMYCLPQIQCHSNIPKYNFFQECSILDPPPPFSKNNTFLSYLFPDLEYLKKNKAHKLFPVFYDSHFVEN